MLSFPRLILTLDFLFCLLFFVGMLGHNELVSGASPTEARLYKKLDGACVCDLMLISMQPGLCMLDEEMLTTNLKLGPQRGAA